MWLLLLISLGIASQQMPFSAVQEVVYTQESFATEKKCYEFAKKVLKANNGNFDGSKQFFCMPLNGRNQKQAEDES